MFLLKTKKSENVILNTIVIVSIFTLVGSILVSI